MQLLKQNGVSYLVDYFISWQQPRETSLSKMKTKRGNDVTKENV